MNHKNFKSKLGEQTVTSEGYCCEIIEYISCDNCKILLDKTIIIENVRYESFKRKMIKNPYKKSVYGVGYLGQGKYKTSVDGKHTKSYTTWRSMLGRTYDEIQTNSAYNGVTVYLEWHNFQVFAEWFEKNWKPWMDTNWQLDKDILFKKCKTYSPETCCFITQNINKLFTKRCNKRGDSLIGVCSSKHNTFIAQLSLGTGKQKYLGSFSAELEAFQAYKTAKEQYIKEVADKWKGVISDKVYEAMYNYEVEITD